MIRSLLLAAPLVLLASSLFSNAQTTHAKAGDADAGSAVFQHSCIMCHAVTPDAKIVGPSLYSAMRGPHAKTSKSVRTLILNGKGLMPAFDQKLTDTDIADLLAYLRTL